MNNHILKILILSLIIFIINLPFGYFRGKSKKYSFKWFLYIHLPIPLIVFLRIYSNIGFAFYTYPIFVAAFFFGQTVGALFESYPF